MGSYKKSKSVLEGEGGKKEEGDRMGKLRWGTEGLKGGRGGIRRVIKSGGGC